MMVLLACVLFGKRRCVCVSEANRISTQKQPRKLMSGLSQKQPSKLTISTHPTHSHTSISISTPSFSYPPHPRLNHHRTSPQVHKSTHAPRRAAQPPSKTEPTAPRNDVSSSSADTAESRTSLRLRSWRALCQLTSSAEHRTERRQATEPRCCRGE